MSPRRTVLALAVAATWSPGESASFLSARQTWGSSEVSAQMVEELVLSQLSGKNEHSEAMQQDLLPTYQALPKNEHGLLDPPTARYALHRYFVQKYGWYVRGLDPKGGSWDNTTTDTVSKDRLPQHVQSLFHQNKGLDLKGLAAFGTVLSKIMEDEVLAGIDEITSVLQVDRDDISDSEYDKLVEGYLARVILGGDEAVRNLRQLHDIIHEVAQVYSEWPNTVMWGEDAVRSFDWRDRNLRNPFVTPTRNFNHLLNGVRAMMHQFNELNVAECAQVKSELTAKETAGSGRINLVDFYSDYKRKRESVDYLRNIGVLDETDAERPKLLIANFLLSSSNCIVDASYYSSCCVNECEALMGHLERKLAAPEAKPEAIADLVSKLPSDTVLAPRNLTHSMLDKLRSIADKHGGLVPLHGRLFSQWMHHAYPRECPFPMVSGSFKPMTQDEFMNHHELDDVFVHDSQIAELKTKWRRALSDKGVDAEAPWDTVEELVAQQHRSPQLRQWSLGGLRVFMALAAFGSMTLPLVRSTSQIMCGKADPDYKTHLV